MNLPDIKKFDKATRPGASSCILGLFSLLLLVVLIVLALSYRIYADDTWWHMATGRYILETGSVPSADLFSFTFFGKPWVNWEWLPGVCFYLAYDFFGPVGLQILRFILVGLLVALAWKRSSNFPGAGGTFSIVLRFTLVAMLIVVLTSRGLDRPHLFGYIYFAGSFLLAERLRDKVTCFGGIAWFLLLLVWTQSHPSWILGISFSAALIADPMLDEWKTSGFYHTVKRYRYQLFILILMLILTLGLRFFSSYSEAVTDLFASKNLVEWQSVFTLISDSRLGMSLPLAVFLIVWGLLFSALIVSPRSFLKPSSILLAALAILSVLYARFAPYLVLAAIGPIVSVFCPRLAKKLMPVRTAVLVLVVIGVLAAGIVGNINLVQNKKFGFGLDRINLSADAADFMQEENVSGNLVTNWLPLHAFFSYRLYPDIKVFVDGRTPQLFPLSFVASWERGMRPEGIDDLLRVHPIDLVLINRTLSVDAIKLFEAMKTRSDFEIIYADSISVIFKRNSLPPKSNRTDF